MVPVATAAHQGLIVFSAGPHLALSDISADRVSVYSETLEFNSCSIARNSTRNSALEWRHRAWPTGSLGEKRPAAGRRWQRARFENGTRGGVPHSRSASHLKSCRHPHGSLGVRYCNAQISSRNAGKASACHKRARNRGDDDVIPQDTDR